MVRLNLGCGGKKLPGYVNIDSCELEAPDVLCDLGVERWPFEDSTVDEAIAEHVLEHLPGEAFFHFMRELYRVLKPGAPVRVLLPHPRHDIFLSDPTHCRAVMPGTLLLFSRGQLAALRERGVQLTDFGTRCGVDFKMDMKIAYIFDAAVDTAAPDLEWQAKHLNNVIKEWSTTLWTVK